MKLWQDKKRLNKIYRVISHLLFWIVIISAYTFLYGSGSDGAYLEAFLLLICTLPIYVGATYYTIYFILPKFLFTKRYRTFTVHFIYMSLISMFLELLIIMFVFVIPVRPFGIQSVGANPIRIDIGYLMIGIYFVIILAMVIKLLKHWYEAQQQNLKISKEKVEAELKLLKSQIHPHFLFNTLNNLYVLVTKKSDQAPEIVLKLSELLDYMLYECNAPVVALEREIQALKDYIELEKLRYGERLSLDFKEEGRIKEKVVAPLLLIPFIENSFKHGIGSSNQAGWINILIKVEQNSLIFLIENSISNEDKKPVRFGLGLTNVQKRLDLLYPGQYQLDLNKDDGRFKVSLTLELSKLPNGAE